jgi:hypothetical protein
LNPPWLAPTRHGGLNEPGDADLTDTKIRALSRQKSSKVLPRSISARAAKSSPGP